MFESSRHADRPAEWFSDVALAKQAEAAALGDGVPIPADLLCGILEPRVRPAEGERCVCCGLDARDEAGGEAHGGRRWCRICTGRGHHE